MRGTGRDLPVSYLAQSKHTVYICEAVSIKRWRIARRRAVPGTRRWERFENPFVPHGVAQCLESLGELSREAGMLAEARRLVQQAIELYRESGDEAAVAAAGGTLGDILLEKGEVEKAQTLYQEGLAFWKERQHPRWTEKFANRLQRLRDSARDSCKMLS